MPQSTGNIEKNAAKNEKQDWRSVESSSTLPLNDRAELYRHRDACRPVAYFRQEFFMHSKILTALVVGAMLVTSTGIAVAQTAPPATTTTTSTTGTTTAPAAAGAAGSEAGVAGISIGTLAAVGAGVIAVAAVAAAVSSSSNGAAPAGSTSSSTSTSTSTSTN
jgi:hypothetical protein